MESNDPILAAIEDAITRAEQAKSEIDLEIQGLILAAARRTREIQHTIMDSYRDALTDTMVPTEVAEWRALPRTEAVIRALYEADTRSMHRKDLTERLIQLGRTDETIEAVSATLAYLAKMEPPRVTSLGQGWWRYGPPHENPYTNTPVGAEMAQILSGGVQPEHSERRFGSDFTTPEETADHLGGTSQ